MSSDTYPFVRQLLRHWEDHQVPYLPGVSEAQLRSFEDSYRIRLPADMRAFYLATNGVQVPGSQEVDDRNYRFWPLDHLRRVENHPSRLYFADYQEWSWQFALESNEPDRGTIYIVSGGFIKVASTFSEFIELYLTDDVALYPISWYKN